MPSIDKRMWEALNPLLEHALDLTPTEREAWLAELRAKQPEMAQELERILGAEERLEAERFLEVSGSGDLFAAPSLAGQRLGAYTLLRPLGQGGMGSVWLGRRSDGRYEGVVAVKLLNVAFLGRAGDERFRREGTVLARLTHPNIARLIDAGVSGSGQPYLVLDYVDGRRIDEYCDEYRLAVPARLRVLQQVLDAVTHAHANLIVHRDLKPSNILVTTDGMVKLLDFGIAKLLEGEQAEGARTELTDAGGRMLTPEYAAPEQVRGDPVTTATDVYSLGVLLYVLLTGMHPTGEGCRTPAEHIRALLDAEPPRASDAVSASRTRSRGDLMRMAEARDSVPERLQRLYRGDVDNILARALRKRPEQRYRTVTALAADLQAFLRHQPVSARPDSWTYRAGKFLRRHRAGVAAAALMAMTLVGATVVTTAQMLEARRQRDAAAFAARRAEASSELQGFLLTLTGPGGEPLGLEEQIASARRMLEGQYQKDPRLLADMFIELSGRYYELNDFAAQRELLARAETLAASVADSTLIAKARCELVESFAGDGNVDTAEAGLVQAQRVLRRLGNRLDSEVRSLCLIAAAVVHRWRNRPDSAVARMTEAVRLIEREAGGMLTTLYAGALNDLGILLRGTGHPREAIEVQRRTLGVLDSMGRGDSYPAVIVTYNTVRSLTTLGEYVQALALVHEQLARSHRGSADRMPSVLAHTHGYLHSALRQDDTARVWLERVLQDSTMTIAVLRAQAHTGIALALLRAHRLAEAGPAVARAAAAWAQTPPTPDNLAVAFWLEAYARRARGDTAGAVAYLERQLDALGGAEANRERVLYSYLYLLGESALATGDLGLAEESTRAALAVAAVDSLTESRSGLVGESMLLLARLLRARGDLPGAAAALERAHRPLAFGFGPDHPRTREAAALADSLPRL